MRGGNRFLVASGTVVGACEDCRVDCRCDGREAQSPLGVLDRLFGPIDVVEHVGDGSGADITARSDMESTLGGFECPVVIAV